MGAAARGSPGSVVGGGSVLRVTPRIRTPSQYSESELRVTSPSHISESERMGPGRRPAWGGCASGSGPGLAVQVEANRTEPPPSHESADGVAGGPAGGSLGGGAEDGDAGGVALEAGAAEEVEAVGHGGEDGVQAGAG